jgi:hypothetical protein
MRKSLEIWQEITIELNGREIRGSYCESGGIVTVAALGGRKSTQVGSSPAKSLARILLRELVAQQRKT